MPPGDQMLSKLWRNALRSLDLETISSVMSRAN